MLFAMAVHAFDCENAAAAAGSRDGDSDDSSSGSAVWCLSNACVALVDAVASWSSTWEYINIARGVSINVLGALLGFGLGALRVDCCGLPYALTPVLPSKQRGMRQWLTVCLPCQVAYGRLSAAFCGLVHVACGSGVSWQHVSL
jgi:hypothetical protein